MVPCRAGNVNAWGTCAAVTGCRAGAGQALRGSTQRCPMTAQPQTMLFALSLGFAAALLAAEARADQPTACQTSLTESTSSAQVTSWKNSFSGSSFTSLTPANTASEAGIIRISVSFRFDRFSCPSAQ